MILTPIRALIALMLSALALRAAAQPAESFISLPSVSIEMGQTVEVDALIDCDDCRGVELVLVYDPDVIAVEAVLPGDYLGANPLMPPAGNRIDPGAGSVQIGLLRRSSAPPLGMTLFTLRVTGRAVGESPLIIQSGTVIENGTSLPINSAPGSITVATSAPSLRISRALSARTGPGTQFPELGALPINADLPIEGMSIDGVWFLVALPDGASGWVGSGPFVTFSGDLNLVPLIVPTAASTAALTLIPSPTMTPSVTPSRTPVPSATATHTITPTSAATQTALTATVPATLTSDPCRVSTTARNVPIHVGPSINRAVRSSFPRSRALLVTGQAEDASGRRWWRIEPLTPTATDTDRYWVQQTNVTASGGCDDVPVVEGSSIRRPTTAQAQTPLIVVVPGA